MAGAADVDPSMLAPADRAILQALRLPGRLSDHAGGCRTGRVRDLARAHWRWRSRRVTRCCSCDCHVGRPIVSTTSFATCCRWHMGKGRSCCSTAILKAPECSALACISPKRNSPRMERRPLPFSQRVGVSCHDAAELAAAVAAGLDFATVSPVAVTASHPAVDALGWDGFQVLAASAGLPVYASGGLAPAQQELARQHGAQGVAGATAFWPAR